MAWTTLPTSPRGVCHGGGKNSRETMPEKPLLFTFRSAKEGG
ncbi:hypothetical protein ACNKHN_09870 [Shigella flexneri]